MTAVFVPTGPQLIPQPAQQPVPATARRGAGVRLLVGTRKGAFIIESEDRVQWRVSPPLFGGIETYHLKGSPLEPNLIYAAPGGEWYGAMPQRSEDGGRTWTPIGKEFNYTGEAGTHRWYDDTPHPFAFKRVWHLEPSPHEVNTIYAGVEDAALFRSVDRGETWQELAGLRTHASGQFWNPGAGGLCLHTIIIDPIRPLRIYAAISAAGVFRSDDGGEMWKPINRGLRSNHIPDPDAEFGHCVHRIVMHPTRPQTLFMQKHWDVLRSDDFGENWREISGNLPTDFGFAINVHAHDPETVFVVPIKSDSEHFPLDGSLKVWRNSSGGDHWQALERGLPQQDCYINVLRGAMTVDSMPECGVYFGTTGGQVYGSSDGGDSWTAIVRDLPAVLSVEVQTL